MDHHTPKTVKPTGCDHSPYGYVLTCPICIGGPWIAYDNIKPDQMPPDSEPVLVFVAASRVKPPFRTRPDFYAVARHGVAHSSGQPIWFSEDGEYLGAWGFVTHWMRLPAAPAAGAR